MKRVLFTLALLSSVKPLFSVERMVVIHSQSGTQPTCASLNASGTIDSTTHLDSAGHVEWKEMWKGYSLFGYYLQNGYRSPQDLSQPGSCQEKFHPLPFIQCDRNSCNYRADGRNTSVWLGQYADENTSRLDTDHEHGYSAAPAIATSHISKCVVCEGSSPVITKHSFTDQEATCPTGWHLLWKGYSFGAATRYSWGFDSGQQLGDTGSCLPKFEPNPAVLCFYDYCDKNYANESFQMWMLNLSTQSDTTLKSNDTASHRTLNEARVGRCAVCSKY